MSIEKVIEDYKETVNESYAGQPGVKDPVMQNVIYRCIENTQRELSEATLTGDMAQYTPVLISLIRRTMPTLVGPEIIGVQPLSMPTGRVFVQHVYARKGGTDTEVWANGTVGTATAAGAAPDPDHTGPYTTAVGEALGRTGINAAGTPEGAPASVSPGTAWPEMSFTISSVDVSVKTRALKGIITSELIQDLRSVHSLDAEQEIANILQTEITSEIDREIVARMYTEAKTGAQNCATPGVFDFAADADGRWLIEKTMGLLVQIEREATWIAQETRRGRGNFIVTSPELAAYLSMANLITNEIQAGFTPVINPVGLSYYGKLANRFKVYVDPYLTSTTATGGKIQHQLIVGYKGATVYDAGMIYAPYVPLMFSKAVGQDDFSFRLGVKSRYGLISNPYYMASASTAATAATNSFFRKISVVVD